MKNENLISPSAAARLAGVSRQAIYDIKKRGTYNFFVGKKVDTDSDHWKAYLLDREDRSDNRHVQSQAKKNVVEKNKIKTGGKPDKGKTVSKKLKKVVLEERQEYGLTGGFNPDDYEARNLADVERYAKIKKLEIEMRVYLSELVEREQVEIIMDSLSRSVQSHLIDIPRKYSSRICKKLGRIGMEKEVEKILSEPIAKGVREIKKISMKAAKIKKIGKR